MACSATALALTPAALAKRMPCSRITFWSYWSMPALIDWTNLSRLACGTRSFLHIIDATTTSASATRAAYSSGFQTWKWAIPVPRAAKRAAI